MTKKKIPQEIKEDLEGKARVIYSLRLQKNSLDEEDKRLTSEIKETMLEYKIEILDTDKVIVTIKETTLPKDVKPEIAAKYLPLETLIGMITISREKFEQYIKENKINIGEEYLTITGSYTKISIKPKIELTRKEKATYLEKSSNLFEKAVEKKSKK